MVQVFPLRWLFVLGSLFALGVSCSSAPKEEEQTLLFETAATPSKVVENWRLKLPGPLTDIAIARKNGAILVASIPDPEEGGKYLLTKFQSTGRVAWRKVQPIQIKAIDLSADGKRAVFLNHESELIALDDEGDEAWRIEAACKPTVLNYRASGGRLILCHHDDATRPDLAFEVFDDKGKKVTEFPIKQDLLAFKLAADESRFVLGLTGGKALLFTTEGDQAFKSPRELKVKGEVLDVAIASGKDPIVAVLSLSLKEGQRVTLFDDKGAERGSVLAPAHIEQIEAFPDGSRIAGYGNSPQGQQVVLFNTSNASGARSLEVAWKRGDPRYADFSSAIAVTNDRVIAGFEEQLKNGRRSRLLFFDLTGQLKSNVGLVTEEGAYLYAFALNPAASSLVVGTDDKTLVYYSLE